MRTGQTTRTAAPSNRALVALAAAAMLLLSACGTGLDSGEEVGTGDTSPTVDGQLSNDEQTPSEDDDGGAQEESVESTATTATTDPPVLEMPELVGMTEAEARTALTDLGLDAPTITTRESFESAGTVLEQVPSQGLVVNGTISLVVAESISAIPDFIGLPIADVRHWAESRGITVRDETKLVTDAKAGTVLEQVPSAGAQASQEILVTLAESPTIVELTSLAAVDESRFSVEDIELNGSLHPKSLVFEGWVTTGFISYNLSRDWASLQMTLGIGDRSDAATTIQVEIVADEQVIYNNTVGFGTTVDVELDVTDVLRLQINTSKLTGGQNARLGLANARLLGGSPRTGG